MFFQPKLQSQYPVINKHGASCQRGPLCKLTGCNIFDKNLVGRHLLTSRILTSGVFCQVRCFQGHPEVIFTILALRRFVSICRFGGHVPVNSSLAKWHYNKALHGTGTRRRIFGVDLNS